MPPSIDVLTSSSAPAWPTALTALKIPLPSPNVIVPKQSFETRFSFLVSPKFPWREGVGRWHGRLPSLGPLHTLTSATGDGDLTFGLTPELTSAAVVVVFRGFCSVSLACPVLSPSCSSEVDER